MQIHADSDPLLLNLNNTDEAVIWIRILQYMALACPAFQHNEGLCQGLGKL